MFIMKTCEDFTACHVLIMLIIHEFYYYINIDDNTNNSILTILNIIGFFLLLLILFMFLFFIEILEFNLFGLSINTKKNIGIRADTDATIYLTDSADNEQSFDSENENDIEENADQNHPLEEIHSNNNSQNEN